MTYYSIAGTRIPYETIATRYDVGTIAGGAGLRKHKAYHPPEGLHPSLITPFDPPEYQEIRRRWEASRASEARHSALRSSSSGLPADTHILRTAFDEFDPNLRPAHEMPALEAAFQSNKLFSRTKIRSDTVKIASKGKHQRRESTFRRIIHSMFGKKG